MRLDVEALKKDVLALADKYQLGIAVLVFRDGAYLRTAGVSDPKQPVFCRITKMLGKAIDEAITRIAKELGT